MNHNINITFINSKKIAVHVPTKSFSNELVEVEALAQKAGQYGNILGFQIRKSDDKTAVIFSLQEDYRSFKTSNFAPSPSTQIEKGDKYFDPNTNQVYEVQDEVQSAGNTNVVQVKDPNSFEPKLVDKDNLLSSTQKVDTIK